MTKSQARGFVILLASHGSQRRAAKVMGLAQSTVSERFTKARQLLGNAAVATLMKKYGKPPVTAEVATGAAVQVAAHPAKATVDSAFSEEASPASTEVTGLKLLASENRRLRAKLRELSEKELTDEGIRRHIFELAHSKPAIPDWLASPRPESSLASMPGVPILFGSDWHWGEVVNSNEIGGINKYNLEIAQARLTRLIDTTIDLLTNHMVNPQYPGIIFALGGDMVSGDIHEELSVTNSKPIMPIVLNLVDQLYGAILRLKAVFGKVFLPCVAGNHGRITKKIRAKEFNFLSYDWLIYQQLDRLFADDPDVVFYIPDGTDALVSVYGHRYLFTHGNQFRGGDGLIGPLGPIVRGDHKKRGRNAQVGQEYDTLVIGHFHQLLQMKRIIVNGSLIGYNEYAFSNNFGYEPPQQALWITHPTHGITFSMPVNIGDDFGRQNRREGDEHWVAFHQVKGE